MTLSTKIILKLNKVTYKQSTAFSLLSNLCYRCRYFSVNDLLVMAYLIIHLLGSMQDILIEYVVGSTLVCDSEHSQKLSPARWKWRAWQIVEFDRCTPLEHHWPIRIKYLTIFEKQKRKLRKQDQHFLVNLSSVPTRKQVILLYTAQICPFWYWLLCCGC